MPISFFMLAFKDDHRILNGCIALYDTLMLNSTQLIPIHNLYVLRGMIMV